MATTTGETSFPSAGEAQLGGNGATPTTQRSTDMLNRVVQGAHQTIDRLAESAAPQLERLEQGWNSTSETLHSRADQARELSDEWAESLRTTVREHPLAAVATALAVGMLIARITR
jgi:ElaB/YqjD/DUF883 family membrane-anchored ribosome-binding protein